MPDALELLKTRRSFKAVELSDPGPRRPRSRPCSLSPRACRTTASSRSGVPSYS